MDPDAALAEIRKLIASLIDRLDDDDVAERRRSSVLLDEALELADLVDGLDVWLRKGGSFPAAWGIRL